GGNVCACLAHESQRAEIDDEMIFEKVLRLWIALGHQAPQASAADFRTVTFKACDGSLGVFRVGSADSALNLHPVAHCRNFTKRYAGLNHAPWARVHAQKEHLLLTLTKTCEV